jgi:large subunit ribosomal protein L35
VPALTPPFAAVYERFLLPIGTSKGDILDEPAAIRHKSALPGRPRVESLISGARFMPKMKTNRAAAKRFRVTGSGKVRRPKGGAQHCMIGKSRKRRRRLRDNDTVSPALAERVKILLPYG